MSCSNYVSNVLGRGMGMRSLSCQSQHSCQHSLLDCFTSFIHPQSGLMAASDAPRPGLVDNKEDVVTSPPGNVATPAFPDPIASPQEFLEYLRLLSIPELLTSCDLLQSHPIREAATNRYVGASVTNWLDKMDTNIVSHLYLFVCHLLILFHSRAAFAVSNGCTQTTVRLATLLYGLALTL